MKLARRKFLHLAAGAVALHLRQTHFTVFRVPAARGSP
jgi:hypothetical protein